MLLRFADWFVYVLLGLSRDNPWGGAVHFFVYDSLKILALLFSLIFVMGVLRSFLPQHRIKEWIKKRSILGNVVAAAFGALTPFCSCSSIPIFISFLEAGLPLGVTFSFLITSPIINEYLVVLMLGFFGWKITVLYVLSGLMIGIVSGLILGKMNLEEHLVKDMAAAPAQGAQTAFPSFFSRVRYGWEEAASITRKIWMWVLLGVGIGSLIHNFVPQEAVQGIISRTGIFSVPLATALGVPMYGSCAAIVPIAVVLFQKGIPLGTALAFMMAIAALSLPEAIMLRRAMKLPLIMTFFGITSGAIILTGYLFNALQRVLV